MVDLLVGLVALAAQGDHIAGQSVVHDPVDGLDPVLDDHVGRVAALQTRQDVGDDVAGLLGPGIVGGHHHEVGDVRGDLSHLGPLGPIPVAAAAEQGHGAALGEALHGGEDVFKTVGAVGVVDEDGIVLAGGGDHLHTPLHVGHPAESVGALLQGDPQGQGRAQHIQRIIYHKSAGNANGNGDALRFRHGVEGDALGPQDDVLRPQVRRGLLGVGDEAAGGLRRQPSGPGVVGVDHAHGTVTEQNGLGVAVGLHGLVEIQVVLSQVGEHTHVVMHPVDPVQGQGVGGDLHDHVGAAGVPHLGEEPLDLEGLRRGALRGDHLRADHVLVGADQPHLGPGLLLQNGLEEVGGAGLAVGAGDGCHGHGCGRVAEEVGADHRQAPAGVLHLDIGDGPVRRGLLTDHRGGAGGGRLPDEGVAVHGKAPHGHKQVAGLCGAGVVADVGDLQIQVCRGGEDRNVLQ